MKYLRFILTLYALIIISNAYAQGMNYAKSGQEAVLGFLETSMGEYPNDSKEMLSYMLPSFRTFNKPQKVNFYDGTWKYIIDKTEDNIFYVALYIAVSDKSACKLVAFQTGNVNGRWYLIPTTNPVGKAYVNPWVICNNENNYVPGTGPYEADGIKANNDEYKFSDSNNDQANSEEQIASVEDALNYFNVEPSSESEFESFSRTLSDGYADRPGVELVKEWHMENKFRIEMGSPRFLYGNENAYYKIRLERDYSYILLVVGENKSLQPKVYIGYTPKNDRIVPEKVYTPVEDDILYPFTTLIFFPFIEESTQEIIINGNVGDPWLNEKYKIDAYLFKKREKE